MRHRVPAFALAALVLPLALSGADADTAAEEALGERLAELLRAARSVVSAHQELINDPSIGEKDLGGDRVVDEAVKRYVEQRGEPPVRGGLRRSARWWTSTRTRSTPRAWASRASSRPSSAGWSTSASPRRSASRPASR